MYNFLFCCNLFFFSSLFFSSVNGKAAYKSLLPRELDYRFTKLLDEENTLLVGTHQDYPYSFGIVQKFNSAGEVVHTKKVSISLSDGGSVGGYSVDVLPDGRYIAVFHATVLIDNYHEHYFILVLFDSEGDVEWKKTYYRAGEEFAIYYPFVKATSDGCFVVRACGRINHPPSSSEHVAVVIRLGPYGDIFWSKSYSFVSPLGHHDYDERIGSIDVLQDEKSFVFSSFFHTGEYGTIVKLDALTGNVQYYLVVKDTSKAIIYYAGVAATGDGGFIVVGNRYNEDIPYPSPPYHFRIGTIVSKFHANGNLEWMKILRIKDKYNFKVGDVTVREEDGSIFFSGLIESFDADPGMGQSYHAKMNATGGMDRILVDPTEIYADFQARPDTKGNIISLVSVESGSHSHDSRLFSLYERVNKIPENTKHPGLVEYTNSKLHFSDLVPTEGITKVNNPTTLIDDFPIEQNDLKVVVTEMAWTSTPSSFWCWPDYYDTRKRCKVTTCGGKWSNETEACGDLSECVEFDVCRCCSGCYGVWCEVLECRGKLTNASKTEICSGHGTCRIPNTCSCEDRYLGLDCEIMECRGVFSNQTKEMCSGHGECKTTPNECVCEEFYSGKDCEFFECQGKLNNQTMCSGHGECKAWYPNVCFCDTGFYGESCESEKICPTCHKDDTKKQETSSSASTGMEVGLIVMGIVATLLLLVCLLLCVCVFGLGALVVLLVVVAGGEGGVLLGNFPCLISLLACLGIEVGERAFRIVSECEDQDEELVDALNIQRDLNAPFIRESGVHTSEESEKEKDNGEDN